MCDAARIFAFNATASLCIHAHRRKCFNAPASLHPCLATQLLFGNPGSSGLQFYWRQPRFSVVLRSGSPDLCVCCLGRLFSDWLFGYEVLPVVRVHVLCCGVACQSRDEVCCLCCNLKRIWRFLIPGACPKGDVPPLRGREQAVCRAAVVFLSVQP